MKMQKPKFFTQSIVFLQYELYFLSEELGLFCLGESCKSKYIIYIHVCTYFKAIANRSIAGIGHLIRVHFLQVLFLQLLAIKKMYFASFESKF
jgi:hypothetical protein